MNSKLLDNFSYDENSENQTDQFRTFLHKKRVVNQVSQKLPSSIPQKLSFFILVFKSLHRNFP